MVKRLLLLTILLSFFQITVGFSQITIGTVDPGPYTPGSSIAVPINLGNTNCIRPNSKFELFLSNASGDFTNETKIGEANRFYTTFVNGIIPPGLAAGSGYKLRVKSTSPILISTETPAGTFAITTGGVVEAKISSFPVLQAPEVFGYCTGRDNVAFDLFNESTAGSTTTGTITNELTHIIAGNLTFPTQTETFTARLAHYTVIIKAKMPDGRAATKAYLLVNNPAKTSFNTPGDNIVCLPGGFLEYGVDLSATGMGNNYPGNIYKIVWGDQKEDTYTLCDLANIPIKHEYLTSSCGNPPYSTGGETKYNVFGINISILASFSNCSGTIGNALSTSVKVVTKPKNDFISPTTACTNTSVRFRNISTPGQDPDPNTPDCQDNTVMYNWFVDNTKIGPSLPKSTDFVYAFPVHGVHKIRLESVSSSLCAGAPIEYEICIQDPPRPAFDFNNQSQTGCAPFTIQAFDRSIIDDRCNTDNTYNWIVTGPPGVIFNPTDKDPIFKFTNPGTYSIILQIITASCGAVSTQIPQKIILADGAPTITMSPNVTLCALNTLDFNTQTGPTKTLFTGTQVDIADTYTWKVTALDGSALDPVNDYSFANSTNNNSREPSIQFKRFIPYKVSVIHKNTCTSVEAFQIITFASAPVPKIDLVPKICYDASANLVATVTGGTYTSSVWTTTGDGTFTSTNTLTTTYTPGPTDRSLLKARVTLTLNTGINGVCQFVPVSTDIDIHPNNIGTNTPQIICTGDAAKLILGSSVPGSTFTWTAANADGYATGFSLSGSGDINQAITNTNTTQNAVVVYTITPTANGCIGNTFTFTVTVTPKPNISTPALDKTICSNNSAGITARSNNIPTQFIWTSDAENGITGNTSSALSSSLASITINDELVNSTFEQKTVTYTIKSYSPGGCEGNTIKVTVTVDPAVTKAKAGSDASICATGTSNTYMLKGNKPDVGTGEWKLISTQIPAPSIIDRHNHETEVKGLVVGEPYVFEWAISGEGACAGTSDQVKITVTPIPIISTTTPNKSICQGNPVAITVTSDIPTKFIWTSDRSSTAITGNTNSTGSALSKTITIPDVLLNSGINQETVTYTIKSLSETGCEGNTITIVVKVDPAVTTATAGADASICNTTTYDLEGSEPHVGTGKWELVSASIGTPTITTPTNFKTKVTDLVAGGVYTFKWTITGTGECQKSEAQVTITVNMPTIPGTTATLQPLVCQNNNTGIITLSGNTGSVLRWQRLPDGQTIWEDVPGTNADLTYTFDKLTMTTQYRAVVQNAGCTIGYSTPTTITVAPATTIADASDQTLCAETSVLLKGNLIASGEAGIWTMVTGDANAAITTPTNHETTVTNLLPDKTYVFRWTITGNSPCGPTFKDVTIRNNAPIDLNSITTNAVVCNGQQIVITGSDPRGGEEGIYNYTWESQLNGGTWTVVAGETGKNLTITLTTTGTVSVRRIVNSGTCTSTSNPFPITVQPPIGNNRISADQTICSGLTPDLINGVLPTGGDGQFLYQWQSSLDGTTWANITGAVGQNYQPPILTATTYYRRIVSTIECSGNLQSISTAVKKTITPNAKAEFTWGPTDRGCVPYTLPVQVVTYADRNAIYTWYADNVVLATGSTFPGYTIQNSGQSVTIKLVVTSSLACSTDEFSHTFSTNQAVPASFDLSDTEGCGPLSVNFTNTSLLTAGATFEWNFGNGRSSTATNPPTIIFDQDPTGKDTTYIVTLKSITACGSNSVSKNVFVKAKPIAIFTPEKVQGCAPFKAVFTNTSPGGTNTYYYDYGDGSAIDIKTNKSPVDHIYNVTVTTDFTVKMIAENSCGRDEKQWTIRVFPQNITPALGIKLEEIEGCAPHSVNFENNTIGASRFTYDFGDGSPILPALNTNTVQHIYKTAGTFTVTMTAYNSCSEIPITKSVTVLPQPIADFEADQILGCPGLEVKFKNKTQDGFSYVWDFGDGSPKSNEFEPSHVYMGNQEYYTVTLTATNILNCSMEVIKNQYIHIVQPPVAAFNVNPSTLISIPNYTFKFEDESTNNPTMWEWNFGDGITSTLKSPNHTYLDTGTYKVTLKVINQNGCFTTTFKNVTIKGVPGYLFVPNSFIPGNTLPELREFRAKGSGIASWRFSVFNKWGQILWETTKLDEGRPAEAWDGTFKGQPMPQGVYYWKIDVQMVNGTEWKGMTYDKSAPKRTGAIHLIR